MDSIDKSCSPTTIPKNVGRTTDADDELSLVDDGAAGAGVTTSDGFGVAANGTAILSVGDSDGEDVGFETVFGPDDGRGDGCSYTL